MATKQLWYFVLLFFVSCRTYNMLEGKSKPVYFTPDASVFNDSAFQEQSIFYEDLLNIRGNFPNTIELKKGKTSTAVIHQPTFFNIYDKFLVYPREHILIKKGNNNDFTFAKIHGSRRRNRELSFFPVYYSANHYPVFSHNNNPSIADIESMETSLQNELPTFTVNSRILFDSLSKAYRVSKNFKKIAGNYLTKENLNVLYEFYREYQDTLKAHYLYKQKCGKLIPLFNSITEKSTLNGVFITFNEITDDVLPYHIYKIKSNSEFKICFDSIENKFSNVAKDYLLSRLMYTAYKYRIPINSVYRERYKTVCLDKDYKTLINKIKEQQERTDHEAIIASTNSLLSVDGKTTAPFENVIAANKGKITLIDFWATWCAPCRADKPYLDTLMQHFSADKFALLSVSIDKEIQPWQKVVLIDRYSVANNFLLINPDQSSFAKQYHINEIPRYMIVNKEGKIINDDAPRSSDPKLKEILDGLVNK